MDATPNSPEAADKPVQNLPGVEEESTDAAAPLPVEPKLPTRKDNSLREFLAKMDDYAPLIPDAVTNYYMARAGLPPPPQTDVRLARLVALATQKFISEVAADAYQNSRMRLSTNSGANPIGLVGASGPGQQAGQPGNKEQGKAGAAGAPLGVQRPGFGGGGQGSSQNRTVLTMEDLGMAVAEFGVNVKRSEFYR